MAGRKPSADRSEAARKAAAAAFPGWEITTATPSETTRADADFVGADTNALKAKYLGAAPDAAARPTNDDAQLIDMKPKGESPVRSRKVIVSGGKVTGAQG
jgi:hypothetical protein